MRAHELRAGLAAALLRAGTAAHAQAGARPGGERVEAPPARSAAQECGGVAELGGIDVRHGHAAAAGECAGRLQASVTNRSSATAFCAVAPVRMDGAVERASWITVRPGETRSDLSWCAFPEGEVRVVCVEESERDWCLMERFAALRAMQDAEILVQLSP